jgi:DNA-binding NarL/FixJ family response regulator
MITLELESIHQYFDQEIGNFTITQQLRRKYREIIFDLISLTDSLDDESDIAIKSKIAEINKRITNPKFKIELNVQPFSEIVEKDYKLTKKEIEILNLLPKGLSIKDMALRLYLTEATIKSHMYAIYKKLEVSNRVQAISKARDNNLLNF